MKQTLTKIKEALEWLYLNWNKSTIFLSIFVSVMLFLYVRNYNYALFLIWLQTPVYMIHQFEEYILPGGFADFFNIKVLRSNKADFPLTKKASFWINVPLTFIAFPLSAIFAGNFGISIGVWAVYFSIINALSHVVMFFIFRYNPGLLVSVLLNIPVGIYVVYYFAVHNIVSVETQMTGLAIGILGQALLMIWGFKILKPKIKKPSGI
jgi:hypothetical protein